MCERRECVRGEFVRGASQPRTEMAPLQGSELGIECVRGALQPRTGMSTLQGLEFGEN